MLQQDRTVQDSNPLLSVVLDSPLQTWSPCVSLFCKQVVVDNYLLKSERARLSLMLIMVLKLFMMALSFPLLFLSCCAWSGTDIPSLSQSKAQFGEISGQED